MNMNEDKHEMFCRVATKRINNALEDLRKLKQMAGKQYYEYNEDDVNKFLNAIEKEFNEVKKAFRIKQPKRFKLE